MLAYDTKNRYDAMRTYEMSVMLMMNSILSTHSGRRETKLPQRSGEISMRELFPTGCHVVRHLRFKRSLCRRTLENAAQS